jgi:hypothetical protein
MNRLGVELIRSARAQRIPAARRAHWPWMASAVVLAMLTLATPARAQNEAPKLTRQERAALQAVVAAVDTAADLPVTGDADWPVHLLRASDGSHYVAFTAPAPEVTASQRNVLYVRLASVRDPRVPSVRERSALAEWLAGERGGPIQARRGIAFGEMPTFGAGAIAARGPGPQSLQLLEMQRERDRERHEAQERERKAKLEGTSTTAAVNALLPFEDFDLRAETSALADTRRVWRRSLTAGPGRYDLFVGWADPAARNVAATVRIVKRTLDLPPASTTEFAISSVIIADSIGVRETPYPPDAQTAHPYSIGSTEIVPAADTVLTSDDRLAVAVQLINPRANLSGKPDVVVAFRLFRSAATGEESVGTIAPQYYNQATLPPDFDVARGHPLFAAIAIPMRAFRRGAYRLQVLADDRLAGTSATSEARFSIAPTPASLLREAPPLVPPFARERLLAADTLAPLVDALAPATPALTRARDFARDGRFVDVIRELGSEPSTDVTAATLRAIALFGLGDTPTAVCTPLRHAAANTLPVAAHILLGACRALEGNDREAIAAWQPALSGGDMPPAVIEAFAASLVRTGDSARAAQLLGAAVERIPANPRLQRTLAAATIASGREEDALSMLTRHEDAESRWLALHALFALHGRVAGGLTAAQRERFRQHAEAYIAAAGPHATLAKDWMAMVDARE